MNTLHLMLVVFLAGPGVGWRGDGSGIFPQAKPPGRLSPKNLLWQTPLPSSSSGQVILVGQRLFLNSEPATLLCVDRNNGQILWQKEHSYNKVISPEKQFKLQQANAEELRIAQDQLKALTEELKTQMNKIAAARGRKKRQLQFGLNSMRQKFSALRDKLQQLDPMSLPPKHEIKGFSSTAPVSDGELVISVFGNGVVAAYTLDGRGIWSRLVEKPQHNAGQAASPILVDNMVVVHLESLIALDKISGKELWRAKSTPSWGTSLLTQVGGESVLVSAASGSILRLSDGKLFAGHPAGLDYASPVLVQKDLFFIDRQAKAFRLPEQLEKGMKLEPLWQAELEGESFYASPVVTDKWIYAVAKDGRLQVLHRHDGSLVYQKELFSTEEAPEVYASLSLAGKRLFVVTSRGDLVIFKTGKKYREVFRTRLEPFYSAPWFSGRRMYLRGEKSLFCYGK